MHQYTADVVTSHLRNTRVAITIIEEWFLILPQALMRMHARTIVAVNRFGHERDGLTMFTRCVLHNILIEEHVIRSLDQRVKADIDFGLSGCANFMMLGF